MMDHSTRLVAVSLGTVLAFTGLPFRPSLAQAPADTVVLTGARIVNGTGRPAVEQASLIISKGRIHAVGPVTAITIPAGAARVDLTGKTIVPGFINSHGHLESAKDSAVPPRDQLLAQLRLYAQYGITTVVSLGATTPLDVQEGIRLRDEQEQGGLDRARLYTAGPVVADKTPDDARKSVDRNADQKVDLIKIRVDGEDSNPNKMTPDVYRAVIDQAHKRGLRVAAHMYYLKDARGLLDAGADILAHSVRDQDVDEPFIAALKSRNIGYVPTLTRELSVFVYETTPAFFKEPFFLRGKAIYDRQITQLSNPAAQEKVRSNPAAQAIKQALRQADRNLKRLSDAGVAIAMGTDSGANLIGRWQGYFEHTELEMMVQAGLTPMQALVAATSGAARVMKREDRIGTIEAGKWADLLVLDANPLSDIRNTRQIHSVWVAGRQLASAGTN